VGLGLASAKEDASAKTVRYDLSAKTVVVGAYDGILFAVYHLSARKEKVPGTTSNEIDAIPETAHDAAWGTVPGGM
jgi:hypothetical protein